MAAAISAPAPRSVRLPTEDDLPYSDGIPMENYQHVLQMSLLLQTVTYHWADREDFFVGGNMFVYFNDNQLRGRDFRGPDVFLVRDVPRRVRKSWVVWIEGKGPDVVIELLSESTADVDRGEKKLVYQNELRVPEYFWFDTETGELAGFVLHDGEYQPIQPDAEGTLFSRAAGLKLVKWWGENEGVHAQWLRWATPDGVLLPTMAEDALYERQRANEAQQRANEAQERADEAQERADEAQQRAARLAEKLRALGIDPDAG